MVNKSFRAVIADDEPLLRYHLDKMLADVWPTLEIIASCDNGSKALQAIQTQQPDLVFLDIKMPEMDGMTLAKRLTRMDPVPLVVFITAYDTYAVEAFEANAIDYLLKPLDENRLRQCVQRIQQRLNVDQAEVIGPDIQGLMTQLQQLSLPASPVYLKWIRVQKGEDIHLVPSADVLFFKAEDKYVSLYKMGGQGLEEFLLRTPLKELLCQLNPEQFWQIHRSTVVNLSAIERIKRDLSGKMYVMVAGQKLAVSRAMQGKFLHNV